MPSHTESEQLIGLPRVARILHVSYPTASLYAARSYFPTQLIDGRAFARLGDVMRFKQKRARQRPAGARSA